jgi:hypothetical protein
MAGVVHCVCDRAGAGAWQWPAALGDPADPTDSAFIPRPEWWVLFLNQLVAIFKGPFMVLGSAIIPGGWSFCLGHCPFWTARLNAALPSAWA